MTSSIGWTRLTRVRLVHRYGVKDKRPIDPPPVARARVFQLLNAGTPFQTVEELDPYK